MPGVGSGPISMHVDARRDEARLERGLEHVARKARVLADEHGAALRAQARAPRRSRAAARSRRSSGARRHARERRRCRNSAAPSQTPPVSASPHSKSVATLPPQTRRRLPGSTCLAPLRSKLARSVHERRMSFPRPSAHTDVRRRAPGMASWRVSGRIFGAHECGAKENDARLVLSGRPAERRGALVRRDLALRELAGLRRLVPVRGRLRVAARHDVLDLRLRRWSRT